MITKICFESIYLKKICTVIVISFNISQQMLYSYLNSKIYISYFNNISRNFNMKLTILTKIKIWILSHKITTKIMFYAHICTDVGLPSDI